VIPVLDKDVVYHVGDEPQAKMFRRYTSFEGPGLSVSEVPEAWRSIAQLGSAPVWRLERKDGKPGVFVDMREVDRTPFLEAAVVRGLVRPGIVYRVYRYDSESDDDHYFVFTDREEAEAEAQYVEETEEFPAEAPRGVVEVPSFLPTAKLKKRWSRFFTRRLGQMLVEEFAISTVLEATKQYDGLWWEEQLDPGLLSAPRGVIFQSKLRQWRWDLEFDEEEYL
jgi:hypothetical protein